MILQKIVQPQTGYYLEEQDYDGFLSVIIPEQRDNYVINPIMQDVDNTNVPTGYTMIGTVGVTKVAQGPYNAYFWRLNLSAVGAFVSLSVTDVLSGYVTASIWCKSSTASKFIIRVTFVDSEGAKVHLSNTKTTSDVWQQFTFTFKIVGLSSGPIAIRFDTQDAGTIDFAAWQLEKGEYATTLIHGFAGEYYRWLGTPFTSASRRYVERIDGGRKVNLKNLGMKLTAIDGLGIPDVDHATTALAFKYGSLFNGMVIKDRQYSMEFVLHSLSLEDLLCARNKVGKAIFNLNQPRCFVWQPLVCNVPVCDEVKFTAVYNDGFSLGLKSNFGEEIKLTFTSYDIDMKKSIDETYSISTITDIVHATLIGVDKYGNAKLFPALPANTHKCYGMTISPYDGNLYAIFDNTTSGRRGVLLQYNGVSWLKIAQVNSTTSSMTAVHAFGKYVYITCENSQTITGQNGYAGTSDLAITRINLAIKTLESDTVMGKIKAGTTLAVDGVTALNPIVRKIVSDKYGNIYVGGNFVGFENSASSTTTRHIAVFRTDNKWYNVDVDFSSYVGGVNTLYYDDQRLRLYVGGNFYYPSFVTSSLSYNVFFYLNFETTSLGVPVRTDFPIDLATNPAVVTAITKYKNRIIIGGEFRSSYGYDLALVDNVAYYDPDYVTPENVKGVIFPLGGRGTGWGTTDAYAVATGIYEVDPVEDLVVCNDILYILGKIETYGIRTSIIGFTSYGQACGVLKYISTAENAEVGTMLPDFSFAINASNALQICYAGGMICSSEKLEMERIYGSFQLTSSVSTVTSQLSIPSVIELCDADLPTEPRFLIRGPGRLLEIANQSYNFSLYFDYTIVADEIISLDLSQSPIKVFSSISGDITYALLPASTPGSFKLFPGDNRLIAKFVSNSTTSATYATVAFTRSALAAETLCCDCG